MLRKEYTILYVDDEEINLSNFKNLFREYNILTTINGEEALKILEQNTVQIIVSDQRMPKMQGTELLSIVAKKYPRVIRIILTGFSDIEAVKVAINQAQIFRYLNKPWDKEELRYTFSQALELYKLREDRKELIIDLEKSKQNLEDKIEDRTRKLREANDMKDHLFSVLAHDLRAPINSLTAALDLLLNYDAVSINDFKNIGTEINYNLKNVKDLLDTLLQWAMNQKDGVMKAKVEVINITELISQNIDLYQSIANTKDIEIIFNENQHKHYQIQADQNMTDFIIRNFIQNAIKFTHKGGKIEINTSLTDAYIKITVKDTGIGMDDKTRDKIFDKQEYVRSFGTKREKGTGLGLKVCAEYAQAQNGKIEVESEVNKGSAFSLLLPYTA